MSLECNLTVVEKTPFALDAIVLEDQFHGHHTVRVQQDGFSVLLSILPCALECVLLSVLCELFRALSVLHSAFGRNVALPFSKASEDSILHVRCYYYAVRHYSHGSHEDKSKSISSQTNTRETKRNL